MLIILRLHSCVIGGSGALLLGPFDAKRPLAFHSPGMKSGAVPNLATRVIVRVRFFKA